jgi:putative DNA primase/helicase
VRRLTAENIDGDAIRAMVADFVAVALSTGADGQLVRAAQRLGLIAAAGELATALGVTP